MTSRNVKLSELPKPPNDLLLADLLTVGAFGDVLSATCPQRGKVTVKIQKFTDESKLFLQRELELLQQCEHANLPLFYEAYKYITDGEINIWIVLEFCEYGSIMNLVKGLLESNRKMSEEHIAFVLREVVKALAYLQENKIIHRNVRGNNILVTKEGEIKLSDFGLGKELATALDKTSTSIGSPGWIAPEIILSNQSDTENAQYGSRCDVWSLGISAIELGDGKSPYEDMHPSRALFQIVRNPPPTLYRPGNWSETYNDFVHECLVKNPEFRPYMIEILEHPFLTDVPENDYHLTQEIKALIAKYNNQSSADNTIVVSKSVKRDKNKPLENIYVEDLAILDNVNEETVLSEIYARIKQSQGQTYIGDILLVLSSNGQDIYDEAYHVKYKLKSRSNNSPHIFGVADAAYQAALHHEKAQHIILTGESCSGKTRNFGYVVDHLLFLGKNEHINQERINDGLRLLQAFTNASTPMNDHSTRCIMMTKFLFGTTGRNTGAEYKVYQLEKNRISSSDTSQANFHILYYFYDGLVATNDLEKYKLNDERQYRFLRIANGRKTTRPKDNPKQNVKNFQKIQEILQSFDFTDCQIQSINNALAAILHLGELNFEDGMDTYNTDSIEAIAQLLQLETEKLRTVFALQKCNDLKTTNIYTEANNVRNILANALYSRIVDFIVAVLNKKLWYGAAIFGDKYSVNILDSFGFESFTYNSYSQLIVNTFNEQLQYFYNQYVFSWEMLDMAKENISLSPYQYYDNKDALDQILGKPEGLFTLIENATKMGQDGMTITDYLQRQEPKQMYVNNPDGYEFCINHYTGKVTYNAEKMILENKESLPTELNNLLRKSGDAIIRMVFTNNLNKTGNVSISFDDDSSSQVSEELQNKKIQMEGSRFRSTGIEIMKELSESTGIHFIRCIRSNLQENTNEFYTDTVKQQIQSLEVVESAKARKDGFSVRVPFAEFLKRYRFLAFDLNENIDVTKDNCRLLLIRLHMEGWMIGKTKVFLKYYNEEYLQRLYEVQVKKIVKIQSIIRSYLVKRRAKRSESSKGNGSSGRDNFDKSEENAAVVIQKAYRNYFERKTGNKLPSGSSSALEKESLTFIRYYWGKWKAKSIFQILLQYRASKYQELYNFSQQIHLYNQSVAAMLHHLDNVKLNNIKEDADVHVWIGDKKPPVLKLTFQLHQLPYFDTSHMRDSFANSGYELVSEESWDAPFNKSLDNHPSMSKKPSANKKVVQCQFDRNPKKPPGPPPSFPKKGQLSKGARNLKPYAQNNNNNVRQPVFASTKRTIDDEYFNNANNFNTTPANKDFDYIKPSTSHIKVKTVNPMMEMQNKYRRQSATDDEPPFNFQAMLRKTNYNPEAKPERRHYNMLDNNSNQFNVQKSIKKPKSVDRETVSIEISPGLFLTGVVFDI